MKLNTLKPAKGSVKNRKRIGRGTGSGKGGTSTRGHKGAKSRSGYHKKIGHEGGQMPLYRRVPKFGFNKPDKKEFKPLNLDTLEKLLNDNPVAVVDTDLLIKNGLISKKDRVKVLSRGEFNHKAEIKAHAFSEKAKQKIEKAGGIVTVIQ
ncbi:MAG: 50S ribosomal protein L15 [Cytophagaceae bacterium]|nr:50S ribosomal protein L15 [Cytophagaceae bacterium]MDW8456729.1 50S ribosomal protein L15 [Cytophagaceae bacterium]